jgi:putative tricarboxylic transport membrane protein
MLDLTVALTIGFVIGIIIGLLPGLPAYLATMVILPFVDTLSISQIIVYWLGSQIGSQYFGSVAAILLKIPGEASSMVYISDLDHLTPQQKLNLIRQCAIGSTVATVLSSLLIFAIYYAGAAAEIISLSSINIKICLLAILLVVMITISDHRWLSAGLLLLGFALSEKTNQTLPAWVFQLQYYTTDITVFSLVMGLLIIPIFLNEIKHRDNGSKWSDVKIQPDRIQFKEIFRGTATGGLMGLIPGPSTIMASLFSYNSSKKNSISQRIISAESANNAATISSLMPFLLVGLPITLSEMFLVDMLQMKLFVIPTDFLNLTEIGTNMIELILVAILIYAVLYHFSAQRFLNFYTRLVRLMHGRLIWIYVALLIYLILVDITFNPVYLPRYIIFLISFVVVGKYLYHRQVNLLPLVFGFILGDTISWSVYQFYRIHFF